MTSDRPAAWKVITAAILDFLLVFIGGGYVIARLTGGITEGGFQLSGGPAFALFALVVAYFVVLNRMGGTVFKRLLGVV